MIARRFAAILQKGSQEKISGWIDVQLVIKIDCGFSTAQRIKYTVSLAISCELAFREINDSSENRAGIK